jgi:hypothetical protein
MGLTPDTSGIKHICVNRSTAQVSDRSRGFSTTHALTWADLNADTLRYWKKNLRPIAGRDGRSCGYTLEEIVALAVINRASTQLNVAFKVFADHDRALFDAVAAYVADNTNPHLVFIHEGRITFGSGPTLPDVEALAIVRIDLVLIDVQERMTAPSPPPITQFSLFG